MISSLNIPIRKFRFLENELQIFDILFYDIQFTVFNFISTYFISFLGWNQM